ncbi:MAG: PQQ-binding-like beta-propeller repeat protein [Phycisphaeraceae bacterium]
MLHHLDQGSTMPRPTARIVPRPALLLAGLLAAALLLPGCGTGNYGPGWDLKTLTPGKLSWRGVHQDGTSPATGLPTRLAIEGEGANLRWRFDTPGRGTAAIAEYNDGPRLYALGYPGSGADLLETIYCMDPETGEVLWQKGYADFISDIVYNRYTIGGPTVDPQTGHVYIQTSPGLLIALDRDGNELWQVSLLEQYGKLTFPNGRTGVVTIDGDLAIVNCISSNWGSEGPARNRFYAFHKGTGELVWSSTPGVGPPFLSDSSFSTPYIENRNGYRVFYAGTGCGNLVCVNAKTGQPMWRYQMSFGGVNASPVVYDNATPDDPSDDLVIQVHGKENIDDTGRGYMIAVKADAALDARRRGDKPLQLDKSFVAWRNDDVSMFTSSPTLVDGVVYQCTIEGLLVAIDAATGETLWEKKFGIDQLHASPVFADGRMYLAMWHDGMYVFTPTREGPKDIEQLKFDDDELLIGTPAVWNGKVYLHTTKTLYCFGNASGGRLASATDGAAAAPGPPTALLLQPAEFLLKPGEAVNYDTRSQRDRKPLVQAIDSAGHATPTDLSGLKLEPFIPPTARVKVKLDAEVHAFESLHTNRDGTSDYGKAIVASNRNAPSAGAFKASVGDLSGTARGRILPVPPYEKDFEDAELDETDETDGVKYAYPPLPWLGARLKWQVREDPTDPDNQVLAKTLDRVLFQRSMIFMGHPDESGYTIRADVMSDGNRRGGSVVGLICQRYIIALDANKGVIEVSSNPNRVQITEDFSFKTKTWYTLKAKVVADADGGGTVYGKAWPRGEDEPADWSIAAKVPNVHTQGSPGIYGFSPQSRHRVYVDNVKVTPTE